MQYLFYCLSDSNKTSMQYELPDKYYLVFWMPSHLCIVPRGVALMPFGVWWVFHQMRIFRNRHYGLALIYHGDHLIHRSGIFPPYFRFPFMAKDDLQIGDTWTHPEYRGQGLAKYAIQEIVRYFHAPGRRIWYLVEQSNLSSIHVIEKSGFQKIGIGIRMNRFGIPFLGFYAITHTYIPGNY